MRRPAQPTSVTVRGRMPVWESLLHALAIMCTFGVWYPVYRSRLKQHRSRSYTYTN